MADVELRITADLDSATKQVKGFTKEFADLVNAVKRPLGQVGATRALERDLQATGDQIRTTQSRLRDLQAELIGTDRPSEQLKQSFRDTGNELTRLERLESRQTEKLRQMRAELSAAGVDTSRLAQEQRRLTTELNAGLQAGRQDAAVRSIRARKVELFELAAAQRQSSLEAARTDLGVNRYRSLQAELVTVRNQYDLLRSSGRLTGAELAIAQRTVTQRIKETQTALRELKGQQAGMGGGALSGGLATAAGIGAAGYALYRGNRAVAQQADEWVEMTDRIKLASNSQEEYEAGLSKLREISDRTFTSMTNNAEIFITSLSPLRERGFSNGDALKFTEAIGLGLVSSAAKGEKAVSVINQLSNALQDGTLKGDAFTSIIRNTPTIADALTTSLGKTREELTAMASAGQLTTDVWVPALISQLDTLGSAVDHMNTLVSDAGVILENAFKEAVGKADVQPLVTAIKALAETIRDPAVTTSISWISTQITNLGAIAVSTARDFLEAGNDLGIALAKLGGATNELADVDRQIKKVEGTLKGMGLGDILARQLYTEDDIKAELAALQARRSMIVERLTGMNAEQQQIADQAAKDAEQRRSDELTAYRQYVASLKTLQGEQVKAAAEAAKKQVAAEKAAAKEIEKVKQDRLKIEQRYAEALAGFNGPAGNSFLNANTLKFNARQALNAGDVEGAQRQAQAALKMLQELASAGENTMGFTGIANELRDIELAANDIEQSNAEQKLQSIKDEMAAMKAQAAELKDMPVSVAADQASIDAVRAQIEELVAKLGNKEVVIPVRLAKPDGLDVKAESADGFATGGWTGPGSKYQPAGIVHADEHVQPKRVVNEPGALPFLERVRRNGFQNTMSMLQQRIASGMRGYAEGGLVGARMVPAIPQMDPAIAGGNAYLGDTTLMFPSGETLTVSVPESQADNFRKMRLKFGRTKV